MNFTYHTRILMGLLTLLACSWVMAGEGRDPAKAKAAFDKVKVSMSQALEAAQKQVPGGTLLEVDLEMPEKGPVYAISLLHEKLKKEVRIDAASGSVLKVEAEEDEDDAKEAAEAAKVVAAARITLPQAIQTATKAIDGGRVYEAELKLRDGKPRFEVFLLAKDKCMEAQIDAISGKVLRSGEIAEGPKWRKSFAVDKANLVHTGRNRYFILEPGYRLHYRHGNETLTITVLADTKKVDGVQTRVVEEREQKDGRPIEVSRNYFAIDKNTKDVYYFGEDVDMYKKGKVVGHGGAWLAGVKGARFGLMMPGKIVRGDRFYQEYAPDLAMDRAEIAGIDERLETPAGVFEQCLHVKETTPLEPDVSQKWYAPGVGLIKDDEFVLVRIEKPGLTSTIPKESPTSRPR